DCSLKIREPEMPAPFWFLDPGGWSKTAVVGLYFIFPKICTLSLHPVNELLYNIATALKTELHSSEHIENQMLYPYDNNVKILVIDFGQCRGRKL
ncbi:hypothetical protein STEG23_028661, partial [Scotinomys teguina]